MTAVTDRAVVMAVLGELAAANFMALSDTLKAKLGRIPDVLEVTECCAIAFGYGCGVLSLFNSSVEQMTHLSTLASETARKTASDIMAANCVGRA